MAEPTWHPDGDEPVTLEENWLFRLRRERFRSRTSGKTHDYFVMHLADAVCVIAVTDRGKLVLVRQFRAGSGHDSLEPPGGLVAPGEDPLLAAARELAEETGYVGDSPRLLGVTWSNPSILSSRFYVVLVTNARHTAQPTPDFEEELQVELVLSGQVPWMIRDGRIDHALAVQGILLWLTSELPGSPWSPEPTSPPRRQFHIAALMGVVAACGGLFAVMSWSGPYWSLSLLLLLSMMFGPVLALRVLDPSQAAVLLRGHRSSVRYQSFRLLAALGMMLILFALGWGIYKLLM